MAPHPLDQITVPELKKAVAILKAYYKGQTIHIKTGERNEPPKEYMKKYLAAETSGNPIPPPPRVAYMLYYVLDLKRICEMWINLTDEKIEKVVQQPAGVHPPVDTFENDIAVEAIFKHPDFLAAVEKCGMTSKMDCITTDCWMYGADERGPDRLAIASRRMMLLMYCRDPKTNHPDSNIYAFPLPFVPVWDILERKLVRIDWCATGDESDDAAGFNYNTRQEGKNVLDSCQACEYLPELQEELRTDLKPYNVVQPEGPSFTINGSEVYWQKWKFRITFTPREGLVLHNMTFDGRSTFYRIAINEMCVPYGDPRPPHHRKMAFDFGDCGGGKCANELELGCDCLGTIKYFDGNLVDPQGNVFVKKNVICMHEQDDGVQMKHTNYRTNVPVVQRRRILVLQTILTVGNYEYLFAYHLDQAAGIKLEIRATGIVSTQYIDANKRSKWGTIVSPSVLAASHQHIFNLRVDPAIDGHNNSIAYYETKRAPWDSKNPKGTGFYNQGTFIEKSSYLDVDLPNNRYIKICNENKKNPISGNPVGYKLHALPTALLMAQPGSVANDRAAFATHAFWVSKYRDQEFYAGGVFTNQSAKENGGVMDAVSRNENVRNEDVVLWHSFGLTHHPRVEDFPVMPVEMMSLMLAPNDFFTKNPAIDVPPSTQKFNRSVLVDDCNSCHI